MAYELSDYPVAAGLRRRFWLWLRKYGKRQYVLSEAQRL